MHAGDCAYSLSMPCSPHGYASHPHAGWRQVYSYASPRDDVNAPDMYIPVMSFITYVLVVGVAMGQASPSLHPLGTAPRLPASAVPHCPASAVCQPTRYSTSPLQLGSFDPEKLLEMASTR